MSSTRISASAPPAAARRGQPSDVFGEREFVRVGGGERDVGPGREVVDDLGHRPALVDRRFFGVGEVLEDFDGVGAVAGVAGPGKVAAGDVVGGVGRPFGAGVEGVGEDPDRHPCPFDVEGVAGGGGAELGVPLRGDQAVAAAGGDDRGEDRVQPFDAGQGAELGKAPRRRERGDDPVFAADVDDARPPAASSSAAPPKGSRPSAKRTLTRTWLPRRTRLPGPLRGRLRRASCTRCGALRTAGLTSSESRARQLRVPRRAELGARDRRRQRRGEEG